MRGLTWWVGGVGVVAVAWALVAIAAPAQQPLAPPVPSLMPPSAGESTRHEDPEVQPAQFTQPGGALVGPGSPSGSVPDPPVPVVRIQVRVPADSPPGDDLKYVITVQNTSAADAHGVTVRNPLHVEVAEPVKAEPEWDKAKSTQKELIWHFGTLAAGRSKTIELTLRPKPNVSEVKNLAYVRFEHGQAVTTRLNKPAVRVSKVAPKQTVRDEPYTVRIAVDNTGKVAAENVRVVENLPQSADVEPITKGGRRTDKRDAPPAAEGQQWVWEIPKLMPGERKVIEYRVTAHDSKDVYALTSLDAAKGIADRAEARTLVLVPGLTVKLTGPTGIVNSGDTAKYEITVRNPGTLPATSVRVTGTLPADCRPTKKTEGGQVFKDAIQWVVPRLEPGEAQSFRFEVKANTTGRRVVVASVTDARGQRAADELATHFQGTAALVWESVPDPVALSVRRQGTFTVRVRNNGGEDAKNVRVEVDVPSEASVIQTTPRIALTGNKLVFGPETIKGYGDATFTITYEAKQAAQAWFKLKMTADCLGDRPMQTQKAVEITGGGG